jgi:hypothetical protein
VIRLRRALDRGIANRWLRILVVVLLAVLVAFVIFHGVDDAATEGAFAGCLAVIAVFLAITAPRVLIRRSHASGPTRRRGPPRRVGAPLRAPLLATLSTPLRR